MSSTNVGSAADDLSLPISAIIVIAVGCYLILIVILILIRECLKTRGLCVNCCQCCTKQPENQSCECCIAMAEACNCCGNCSIRNCLDGCCKRRRYDCLDIMLCQCLGCTCCDPNQRFQFCACTECSYNDFLGCEQCDCFCFECKCKVNDETDWRF